MHSADPRSYWYPLTYNSPHYGRPEEDQYYNIPGMPTWEDLIAQRDAVVAKHPKTIFIGAHFASMTLDLSGLAERLDRYPNLYTECGARLRLLGRLNPKAVRDFFTKYQDRILFGTDAIPHGNETPQQVFGDALYQIYYRFLETEDEYFDYAPAPVPPQGRWRIYGLGLPDGVLRKVYNGNAARIVGVAVRPE